VAEELVPPSVYQALAAVAGLEKGRSAAKERDPVLPVDPQHFEAALPFLTATVRALACFQRLTGCRPGEACRLRADQIDRSGALWYYRPRRHKTAHRGKARVVVIGPQAQAVIAPLLLAAGPDGYLFSPRRSVRAFREAQRAARKTRVQPSQADRSKADPKRSPRERYYRQSYVTAVRRACKKAGVPHWHPNQLRHLHATEVRKRYGLEGAQVALGHSKADVTQVYAERDLALAERIAREVG
jgi:integrase